MAGIAGDLFLKLYLVILVSGKLALRGWVRRLSESSFSSVCTSFLTLITKLQSQYHGRHITQQLFSVNYLEKQILPSIFCYLQTAKTF